MRTYSDLLWLPVFLLSLLSLSACSSSPVTHYYVLTPMPVPTPASANTAHKPVIVFDPVEVPPYLSRTQIVTRHGAHHLELSQSKQWGGNFRKNISRVLRENLSALLGNDRVFSPHALGHERPNLRITTVLSQFEPDVDGKVVLRARWRLVDLKNKQTIALHRSDLVSSVVNTESYDAMVASMSDLLMQLSKEMAEEISKQTRTKPKETLATTSKDTSS